MPPSFGDLAMSTCTLPITAERHGSSVQRRKANLFIKASLLQERLRKYIYQFSLCHLRTTLSKWEGFDWVILKWNSPNEYRLAISMNMHEIIVFFPPLSLQLSLTCCGFKICIAFTINLCLQKMTL